MGATASINAASKKDKSSEPIEVKFHNVVKYDDGDEKAFKDGFQVDLKKQQPLSLLASAIKMLERKPRECPAPRGYLTDSYSRQLRPRSAYVVLKKGSQSSLSSSNQNGIPPNGLHPKMAPSQQKQKQYKARQNLYMSLIRPGSSLQNYSFPHNGHTMPRVRPPLHMQMTYGQPKSNTLPRHGKDGKRIKVNKKMYMDMIRPVMSSAQYYKFGGNRSIPTTPSTQRTMSQQRYHTQAPRPPNDGQRTRKLHPNSVTSTPQQERNTPQRQIFTPQKAALTPQTRKPPQQRRAKSEHNGSTGNGFLPRNGNVHLPKLTRTKDGVSLNYSLNSRTKDEIPNDHTDNVIPLYFRKSLAYSPHYNHKELLSDPLS